MRAASAIPRLWQAVDTGRLMGLVDAVSRCDRYQASRGIEDAADLVAAEAERAGLAQVTVHRWDPATTSGWWAFAPPASWTPLSASLRLLSAGEEVVTLRYPQQPYGLAANSAPTPAGGITAPVQRESTLAAEGPQAGSVVLLDRSARPPAATARRLAERGVVALIACPTLASAQAPGDARGRIELPGGSPLRAFSLSGHELARVRAVPGPLAAEVVVQAEPAGRMPLVTGVLGQDVPAAAGEVLVQAHLCHPAPGADDNAAGVAALVEIAATLARLRPRPARRVRFVWAPEFTGTAAYLHDLVEHGDLPLPVAAVNLDLVGGAQREVGPIVVDPTPDHVGGVTTAVAEHCLELLPADRRSYSGADAVHDWSWTTVGFTGASDHVLLADRRVAVPAVQLGHLPGPRHHTSADTVAHVDPREVRRVTVAAAATAGVLADLSAADSGWLAGLVTRSAWRRLLRTARRIDEGEAQGSGRADVVDPLAGALRGALVAHIAAATRADLRAVASLTAGGGAARAPGGRAELLARAAADLLAPGQAEERGAAAVPAGPHLRRRWPGPFNLRAAIAGTGPVARAALEAWLDADRAGAYTAMTAIAHAVDGRSPADDVLRRAAFTTGLRIPLAPARTFLDALTASGWVGQTAPDRAGPVRQPVR